MNLIFSAVLLRCVRLRSSALRSSLAAVASWLLRSSPDREVRVRAQGRVHCMVFFGKTLFTFIKSTFYTGNYRCIASLDTSANYKRSLAIRLIAHVFSQMQIVISQFPFQILRAYLKFYNVDDGVHR